MRCGLWASKALLLLQRDKPSLHLSCSSADVVGPTSCSLLLLLLLQSQKLLLLLQLQLLLHQQLLRLHGRRQHLLWLLLCWWLLFLLAKHAVAAVPVAPSLWSQRAACPGCCSLESTDELQAGRGAAALTLGRSRGAQQSHNKGLAEPAALVSGAAARITWSAQTEVCKGMMKKKEGML